MHKALTLEPSSEAGFEKTLNSDSITKSLMFFISKGILMSGLSDPNFSIASK